MDDLRNKVVLFTGGSSGVGAAVACAFGAQGARVAVHYRNSHAAAGTTVAHVTGAFLFLASDAASSFITGQIVEVNGGQVMP